MSVDVAVETLPPLTKAFISASKPEIFAQQVPNLEKQSPIVNLSFRLAGEAVKHFDQPVSEETYRKAGVAFMSIAVQEGIAVLESESPDQIVDQVIETTAVFSTFIATLTLIKDNRFQAYKNNFWKFFQEQSLGKNPAIPTELRDLYGCFLTETRRITASRIQGLVGELRAYRFLKACGLNPEKPPQSKDLQGVDFSITYQGKLQEIQVKTDRLSPEEARLAWAPTKTSPVLILNMGVPRIFDSDGVFNPASLTKALSLNGLEPFQKSLNLTLAKIKK